MWCRILYFARLRETFGCVEERVELPAETRDVAALLTWLSQRGELWASELAPGRQFRVAVNQEMATLDTAIPVGAEVAIFPPVTGG
ncbi:molybdopterin converting factor subunit 1 [Chitinivorax sp. B]|uniref:molybdopterin converting factor subunit 1 n=1 Tax=Chitinivorax sp. B TaxID=2502235 RepID=UPI0010F460BB|nr:molybdopterin converting factor subunit 1 [Chitinivorax sp. B]